MGKKLGKHAEDYGLDPSRPEDREQFKNITIRIIKDAEETRYGEWRSQPGESTYYILEQDVVVVNEDDKYVTTLKGGINSERIKKARRS